MKLRPHGVILVLVAVLAATAVLKGCRLSVNKSDTIKTVEVTPEELEQASQSAKKFLTEIDKENGQTWEQLSQRLKASTSETTWSAVIAGMKTACGKEISRSNAQGFCTDELPGSPKGHYFIFDITTKFERADLTERVVLLLENGQWKVAGYFRKKTTWIQL